MVRDHRTGDSGRAHVRDHRAGASSRPKVRDHRLSWGRSRLEDLLGKDRIVVRVPSGRSKSGVSGTVTTTGAGGASGGPLEGARITFSDASDKPVSSVVTDAAGAYRARLAPGHYRVSAVFEGFEEFAAAEPVAVRQDATTDLDIQLAPVVAAPEVHRQPGIQLIAVLCRELPKAPNPDPNLDWS